MQIAKQLGMTLGDLAARMTEEELSLWVIFFEIEREQAEKEQRKTARLR